MSWFSKVEAFLGKIFKNTTWEQSAISAIQIAAPGLEEVVALTDPAIAPTVNAVIKEVMSDLGVIGVGLQGVAGATPTATIRNAANSVVTNLSGLLSAGHIKDTKSIAIVTGIVEEVQVILSKLPS